MNSYLPTKPFIKTLCFARPVISYLFLGVLLSFNSVAGTNQTNREKTEKIRLSIGSAEINSATTEVVKDERLSMKKGASLKANILSAVNGNNREPDLVFNVQVAKAGRFVLSTNAMTNDEGAKQMKIAKSKFESMFIKIQIDDNRPTKRVVYVPWDVAKQVSGKFEFNGKPQKIKIWLPRGIHFDYIDLSTYKAPAIPLAAINYVPPVVPPATRPRLWANQESLPVMKARLLAKENEPAWEKVKETALKPFPIVIDPNKEMLFNIELEAAAERKAFYYLMTGNRSIGKEAIKLMDAYLANVEFGNILDITREIGRAIYTGSEVYDWCYDLLETAEKKRLNENLMRLADDMEVGWPPFLESIVYGHGNEAQICRDLLSMSIAIYDENPLPYQYTSYAVLEELVPMRKFEYQSDRHAQGVSYGAYRFQWDLHAAYLLKRMIGREVFDPNIKKVHNQFLYMRTPDGQMLRDGDGFKSSIDGKPYYWGAPMTMLLAYSYAEDPILKADFNLQGGLPDNPVLFLLLNNPDLKANPSRESLPLSKGSGPVLGSMIARTGWDISDTSDDVLVEIKGGGYQFGNHQHSDAGSVQLYYRGFQFGDIGLYKFYGTPYDMNFTKRSISHSMMLAVDPAEKYVKTESNDGGTRLVRKTPGSPKEVQTDPLYKNGEVISEDFGPSKLKPTFSYFAVDLASAYSSKIQEYVRRFAFVNTGRKDIPAVMILSDEMKTTDEAFKKYWQINSLNAPKLTHDGFVLHAKRGDKIGKTHVNMLLPAFKDRNIESLAGEAAVSSFNFKYTVPVNDYPEANPNRTLVSLKKPSQKDRFLTVFQVADGETKPFKVDHLNTEVSDVLIFDQWVVSMPKGNALINKSFMLEIPKGKSQYEIAVNGLSAGNWTVKKMDGQDNITLRVNEGKNSIFFKGKSGRYVITPTQP